MSNHRNQEIVRRKGEAQSYLNSIVANMDTERLTAGSPEEVATRLAKSHFLLATPPLRIDDDQPQVGNFGQKPSLVFALSGDKEGFGRYRKHMDPNVWIGWSDKFGVLSIEVNGSDEKTLQRHITNHLQVLRTAVERYNVELTSACDEVISGLVEFITKRIVETQAVDQTAALLAKMGLKPFKPKK